MYLPVPGTELRSSVFLVACINHEATMVSKCLFAVMVLKYYSHILTIFIQTNKFGYTSTLHLQLQRPELSHVGIHI